ncbi:hypothetical protein J4Q44_G00182640 [Coregonus suidteri]|uniref:Uncharacterized protein n=1 Tax=Coregonus suidteri TaxID=861788 RepID=A0AAN8LJD8_9TELE
MMSQGTPLRRDLANGVSGLKTTCIGLVLKGFGLVALELETGSWLETWSYSLHSALRLVRVIGHSEPCHSWSRLGLSGRSLEDFKDRTWTTTTGYGVAALKNHWGGCVTVQAADRARWTVWRRLGLVDRFCHSRQGRVRCSRRTEPQQQYFTGNVYKVVYNVYSLYNVHKDQECLRYTILQYCMYNCVLSGTNRYNCVLSGTNRYNCVLSGTNRYNCVLSGTNRYNCVLSGTNRYNCVLCSTRFISAVQTFSSRSVLMDNKCDVCIYFSLVFLSVCALL